MIIVIIVVYCVAIVLFVFLAFAIKRLFGKQGVFLGTLIGKDSCAYCVYVLEIRVVKTTNTKHLTDNLSNYNNCTIVID